MSLVWNAEVRSDEGKGASRRLRNTGKVPGIIYGAGKEPQSVAFASNFVTRVLQDADLFNTVLTVEVAGTQQSCIIKDMQRHPATGAISHIDMQRTDDSSYLTKRVPIKFVGSAVAPGVKMGGLMSYMQTNIEVKALAKDLPAFITVDVSNMEAQTSLRLSQLAMPEGVSIVALSHGNSDYDQAVVGIGKPKAAK